jgi:hypothetical protein
VVHLETKEAVRPLVHRELEGIDDAGVNDIREGGLDGI